MRMYGVAAQRGFEHKDFSSIFAFLDQSKGDADGIAVALAEAWAEEATSAGAQRGLGPCWIGAHIVSPC